MQQFIEEVDANFQRFFESLSPDLNAVLIELQANEERFRQSYRRLVTLQAWRSELLERLASPGSESFFKEAQNDALMSHALARQGAWRVALMCLRSCIENTLCGIYYMDHPVELAQWHSDVHRIGFGELIAYISKHPKFVGITEQFNGLQLLKTEYATLSKAVHGSSQGFRVTKNGTITGLNVASFAELRQWVSRERMALQGLNLCLLTMFRDHLTGATNIGLRNAMGIAIPASMHDRIMTTYKVRLRNASSTV